MGAIVTAMRVWTHVHSTSSYDGQCAMEEIAETARLAGVGAVLLSEHTDRWDQSGYVALLDRCARWRDSSTGPLLIPGLEVTSARGWHILCFGVRTWIEPQRPEHDIVIDARTNGAVVGLAHPSTAILERAVGERLPFDLLEVWNVKRRRFEARWEQCRRLREARQSGLDWAAVIGLDAHQSADFVPAYMELRAKTRDDVLEAFRRRDYTCVRGSMRIRPGGDYALPLRPRATARLLSGAFKAVKTIGTPVRLLAPRLHAGLKRTLRHYL
jgi:predicted metal-dependent phosphoesterase TrpH